MNGNDLRADHITKILHKGLYMYKQTVSVSNWMDFAFIHLYLTNQMTRHYLIYLPDVGVYEVSVMKRIPVFLVYLNLFPQKGSNL